MVDFSPHGISAVVLFDLDAKQQAKVRSWDPTVIRHDAEMYFVVDSTKNKGVINFGRGLEKEYCSYRLHRFHGSGNVYAHVRHCGEDLSFDARLFIVEKGVPKVILAIARTHPEEGVFIGGDWLATARTNGDRFTRCRMYIPDGKSVRVKEANKCDENDIYGSAALQHYYKCYDSGFGSEIDDCLFEAERNLRDELRAVWLEYFGAKRTAERTISAWDAFVKEFYRPGAENVRASGQARMIQAARIEMIIPHIIKGRAFLEEKARANIDELEWYYAIPEP